VTAGEHAICVERAGAVADLPDVAAVLSLLARCAA
jgi:hypothetical protein